MKTFLVAALLALTFPALAQSSKYVTLTLQLDEAAADPATGLMPARVIVAHPEGSGPIMGGVRLWSSGVGELLIPETTTWRCTRAHDVQCTFGGEINVTTRSTRTRSPMRKGRSSSAPRAVFRTDG